MVIGVFRYCSARSTLCGVLQYFTKPADLVIVGLINLVDPLFDLIFHQRSRIILAGDIANRKINALFDDHFISADIRHVDLILVLEGTRALVFILDGIGKYGIDLFRKG